MTREEKLELIAKDQGYLPHPVTGLFYSLEDRLAGMRAETERIEHIPDYFGCLNACRKMEQAMDDGTRMRYNQIELVKVVMRTYEQNEWIISATSEQRAEAYGLARGLWKEGE